MITDGGQLLGKGEVPPGPDTSMRFLQGKRDMHESFLQGCFPHVVAFLA
jgi:hypothetical protein